MQLLKMPLFEVLLPVIESNSIHDWTANDFWKQMKLSKKERHRFNRQRMYRILRKLVELGFLEKELNQHHPRFSLFKETPKINEIRFLNKEESDVSKIKLEEAKVSSEIIFLEKQVEKYRKLELSFPNISNKIYDAKTVCSSQLLELKAYRSALQSVIAS
ncbi:hypothetical protein [Acinetobacter shaoyimingii]|uniref:Uncharacterized protein n=1 Tax=Acinetobacter shaoyimingii TaxID=2715164 RepID=A0A6G8RRS2_9GAMM|nr:hypothetical protein [Acinetobacter shaoyimingii]QIO04669.1 hypothetical protein G8E00_01185 [Acinetobacter shaoyimingii]